jgi:serine/threonine-protein kinase RsbW
VEQEIILKSTLDSLADLDQYVETLCSKANLDEDTESKVHLVLSEACTNAILHGNKMDESKSVVIRSRIDPGKIIIRVRDEGAGFDPGKIPDPLKEDNLLKPSGRGVYLIRQYSDEVRFSEKGNEIEVSINY